MYIDAHVIKIAEVSHRSDDLIKELLTYRWEDANQANLNETRGIWIPFTHEKQLRLNYDHFNVGEKEWPILDLIVPFLEEIKTHFNDYTFLKGEIYNCPANTSQDLHVDPKILHRFCRRIHLPILTNDQSFLRVEKNLYHLEPYCIYDFNNMVPHGSYNNGKTPRIHFVIDLIEESVLNKLREFMTIRNLFDSSKNSGTDLDSYIEELRQIYSGQETEKIK